MTRHPVLSSLLAYAIVALLIAASLTMIFSPTKEEWPEGDLPNFVSEAQMRRYLADRQGDSRTGLLSLTDETGNGETYHSQTNVQVSGVDELDTVKTDGEFLYVSSNNGVTVMKAYPASDMNNVSVVNITEIIGKEGAYGTIHGLFLHDGILAVVANEYEQPTSPYLDADIYMFYGGSLITCCLVNVSDPSSPTVITRYSLSGNFAGSRLIGDYIYLLGEEGVWWMGEISPPRTGVDGDVEDVKAISIRFDPQAEDADVFLNILALDLRTLEHNFTSFITGCSSVMYVSQENIFLTYVGYEAAGPDDTVSTSYVAVTTVFRLQLDGIEVVPLAKGQVVGYPLNQFSLDEHQGMLRMVTCTGWSNSENRVYVLDQDLKVVGSLTGLAPGESIKSARFMGPTLYLVTFLVTDPLFVIDLSDPASPRVLGELVVPGFSAYLHPCPSNRLIGIGLDNRTMKISLFDVHDPTSPTEIDTLMIPLSSWSSEALWDHKAILMDERSGQLMIPVMSWDEATYRTQQQVFVILVQEDGLVLKANLSIGGYYGSVRCVILEKVLYTITSIDIKAWGLGTLEKLGDVPYGPEEGYWPGMIDDSTDEDTVRGETGG